MTFPQDQERAQKLADSVVDEIEALAHEGNAEAMFLSGTAYAEGLGRLKTNPQGCGGTVRRLKKGIHSRNTIWVTFILKVLEFSRVIN